MGPFFTDLESARCKSTAGLILIVSLFTFFEYFRTPVWGQALRGEGNLWTIASGFMNFLVGIVAFVCAVLARYLAKNCGSKERYWAAWLMVSLAFLYFSFDETIEIHERLGKMLRHYGVDHRLFGLPPHNVVEATYYLGAIILTLAVLRRLMQDARAFRFYMSGIGCMAFQTILGLLPKSIGHDRLPLMFAEVLEMAALTFFACAFMNMAFGMIRHTVELTIKSSIERPVAVEHVLTAEGVGNSSNNSGT